MNTTSVDAIPGASHLFKNAEGLIVCHEQGVSQGRGIGIARSKPESLRGSPPVDSWSDAELMESMRGELPNEAALDVLIAR